MVYKKYIKKNSKVYGPYTYHSKRVDGKVVSSYLGPEKNSKAGKLTKKNFLFIGIGVFLLLLAFFLALNINRGIHGQVVMETETLLNEDGSIDGLLKLSVKEGELIPSNSKVVIEDSSGNYYEYLLTDLLSGNEEVNGNYYVQGKELSGEGTGFGVPGEIIFYPDLYFTLNLESQIVFQDETPASEGNSEVEGGTDVTDEIDVVVEPNNETETTNEGNATEETTAEEETTEEEVVEEETPIEEEETTEEEASVEEEVVEEEAPVEEETTEETITEESTSPITGQVTGEIESSSGRTSSSFVRTVGGFFARMTGNAVGEDESVLEVESEIEGVVSGNEPYTYALSEGETVELEPGSVKTASGEVLNDSVIDITINDDEVLVTTSYSQGVEEGFGEDYLGEGEKEFAINLSQLDLDLEEGGLNIRLVYGNEELLSVDSILKTGETTSSRNETEIAVEKSVLKISTVLTEQEKKLLIEEFGENFTIDATEANIINKRLVVRYELGKYWSENSYDYDGTVTSELKSRMERDRNKWLKDIAVSLSEESEGEKDKLKAKKEVEGITGKYEVDLKKGQNQEEIPIETEDETETVAEINDTQTQDNEAIVENNETEIETEIESNETVEEEETEESPEVNETEGNETVN